MTEIIGFYNEIGNFETYVGDIIIINDNIILPIYSSQLVEHPLNTTSDYITHLDYCYYVFRDVKESKRDVYDNKANLKFEQISYIRTKHIKETSDFLLELVDFNGIYQYWNWIIKAAKFSLIVDNNYNLRKESFNKNEMNLAFFETNHFEKINCFF
jgi:hypothetical protein